MPARASRFPFPRERAFVGVRACQLSVVLGALLVDIDKLIEVEKRVAEVDEFQGKRFSRGRGDSAPGRKRPRAGGGISGDGGGCPLFIIEKDRVPITFGIE